MALIIRDVLYLKVDDAHRATFEDARCKPFTYAGKNDETHMLSYYTAPEEAMESPAEMTPCARRALAAAVAARARGPTKKPARTQAKTPVSKKVAPGGTAVKKTPASKTATPPRARSTTATATKPQAAGTSPAPAARKRKPS
jgi:DNA transformation protein